MRLPGEPAHGLGEIAGTDQPEPVDGRVAEGGQIVGGVTAIARAAVFGERRIADMMKAVFDRAPVVADERQQAVGIGLGVRERRDGVGGLDLVPTLYCLFADHAADLVGSGPVAMVVQCGRGGDGPLLKPTVTFVERAGCLLFGDALLIGMRGLVLGKRKTVSPGRR